MNELALFAGAGGGILGGRILGWRTVCAVEWDEYARRVLEARQDDGSLEPFPIWDDVQTFDGRPWRGVIDVVSGGFPCQDISIAGKGAGIDGERSGMWGHMARIICEVRPRFVFVENSPMLASRGLGRVLGDMAAMGYDAEWGVLGAADVGAPHRRERMWIVGADAMRKLRRGPEGVRRYGHDFGRMGAKGRGEVDASGGDAADHHGVRELQPEGGKPEKRRWIGDRRWWAVEPDVGRVAHGVAARMDRLRCLGNGQVPQCAAEAFRQLYGRLTGGEWLHDCAEGTKVNP